MRLPLQALHMLNVTVHDPLFTQPEPAARIRIPGYRAARLRHR